MMNRTSFTDDAKKLREHTEARKAEDIQRWTDSWHEEKMAEAFANAKAHPGKTFTVKRGGGLGQLPCSDQLMETWADEKALYIWSGAVKADLTPIKAAKLALGIEQKVKHIAVISLADLYSLDSRVLAIGSRPPFLCKYALTSENTSAEGWQRALRWVLGLVDDDPKATDILDTLSALMPPGESGQMLREITPEEYASETALYNYMNYVE